MIESLVLCLFIIHLCAYAIIGCCYRCSASVMSQFDRVMWHWQHLGQSAIMLFWVLAYTAYTPSLSFVGYSLPTASWTTFHTKSFSTLFRNWTPWTALSASKSLDNGDTFYHCMQHDLGETSQWTRILFICSPMFMSLVALWELPDSSWKCLEPWSQPWID